MLFLTLIHISFLSLLTFHGIAFGTYCIISMSDNVKMSHLFLLKYINPVLTPRSYLEISGYDYGRGNITKTLQRNKRMSERLIFRKQGRISNNYAFQKCSFEHYFRFPVFKHRGSRALLHAPPRVPINPPSCFPSP